ncbi:MAG: DUF58 domain-containing protein [Pseudomonadota bacterium]
MLTLDPDHLLRLRPLARRAAGAHAMTSLPGGFVTRRKGPGLETADLRAFTDGDDPRHIDRNATARSGRLQVRTFQAERDRTTLLIADFRPSMLWGTRRTLRSIAEAEALCLAGWHAVAEGGRAALLAVSATEPVFVPPQAHDRAMVAIIGAMARAHDAALRGSNQPDPPLGEALMLARRIAPRRAEVVLATGLDTPGPAFDEAVLALNQRTSFSVIRIVDAFETAAPRERYRFYTTSGLSGAALPPDQARAPDIQQAALTVAGIYQSAVPPDRQTSLV